MKVLMLGWEFPPFFAGGVGMVCYELTREMAKARDVSITYVMPFGPKNISNDKIKVLVADNLIHDSVITIKKIPSLMNAYMSEEDYEKKVHGLLRDKEGNVVLSHDNTSQLYGKDLISEVYNFAEKTKLIVDSEEFDIIHAHDWQTIPAAIVAKRISGKPLVIHVHNTIYDRYLGKGGDKEKEIEKEGFYHADKIIAISYKIRDTLVNKYGINSSKIEVIHNAKVDLPPCDNYEPAKIKKKDKVVLYAGRVTIQKGPDYFVEAAAKVLKHYKNVKFIIAGSGDMLNQLVRRVAELGISDKFIFHGFYSREEGTRLFRMADVFVMPSVSEPFGVVPLEAMLSKTPTIISKQSGCSEAISNSIKVDFWDTDRIADSIVALLKYGVLNKVMSEEGLDEVNRLTWDKPAARCVDLYRKVIIGRVE